MQNPTRLLDRQRNCQALPWHPPAQLHRHGSTGQDRWWWHHTARGDSALTARPSPNLRQPMARAAPRRARVWGSPVPVPQQNRYPHAQSVWASPHRTPGHICGRTGDAGASQGPARDGQPPADMQPEPKRLQGPTWILSSHWFVSVCADLKRPGHPSTHPRMLRRHEPTPCCFGNM